MNEVLLSSSIVSILKFDYGCLLYVLNVWFEGLSVLGINGIQIQIFYLTIRQLINWAN